MLPLIMAVCGAAGAVAGVVTTQAANEKNKQAVKRYEKVNSELINSRNELEKRYYELSDKSQQQINDLNLKLAESEMEKDLVYLALNLYHELMALREHIDINPSFIVLKDFHKAITLTNYVLKQLDKHLVPISQNYFTRTIQRIDERDNLTKENLLDFIAVLMNPEEEILTSFISEVQNEIVNQEHLQLEEENQKTIEIEAIESEQEVNKNHAECWIQQGNKFLKAKEYEQAVICFDKACAINSDNDEVWCDLSFGLYQLDRIGESLNAIDKALAINPDEDIYWYQQSCCLSAMEMNQEALKALEKALKINPDEDSYWYQQSNIFHLNTDYFKAIKSINKAINISYNNDEYWNYQGIILLDKHLYKNAYGSFNKAIELNPTQTSYWTNKAIALYFLERNDEALDSINQAIEINSDDDNVWYWQGRILFEMNMMLIFDRKEEALESFEKAIIINPDNDEYWYCKSRCLADLYKEKEALKAIKKAIALQPENSEYMKLYNKLSN